MPVEPLARWLAKPGTLRLEQLAAADGLPPLPPLASQCTVALVRQQSRLVASRSAQPLKLLNPRAPAGSACHVVQASYGGGLLAGDCLRLRVQVEAEARLLLSTQANTRIFRSDDGRRAEQHLVGEADAGALAAVLPDPLVPQAASRYRQTQRWDLAPTATLLLADWWQAGRTEAGERFAFTEFATELRMSVAGRPVLLDRFALRPAEHLPTSAAALGPHCSALTLYLVGPPAGAQFQQLAAALHQLPPPGQTALHAQLAGRPAVVAVSQARDNVVIVRALGRARQDLDPLYRAVSAALAGPALLGFDWLERKY